MNNELIPIENKKQLSFFENILLYFFIYSFIGWLMETTYCYFDMGYFTKRGFLFGPICPIYGNGALILLFLLQPFKDRKVKLFFVSAIVFSIFEYIVGYGLEALFSMNFWDYSTHLLNLNGRITLEISIIWGFLAILFINYIHPFIKKWLTYFLNKMPFTIHSTIIKTLFLILVVDNVLSFIRYLI